MFYHAFDSGGTTLDIADIRIEGDAMEMFESHADLRRLSAELRNLVDHASATAAADRLAE